MTENNRIKIHEDIISADNSNNQINSVKTNLEQMLQDLNIIKSGIENFKNNESFKQFFNEKVNDIFANENIDLNILQNQLKKLDFKIEINKKSNNVHSDINKILQKQENEFSLKKLEVNKNFNNNYELIKQLTSHKTQFEKLIHNKLNLERKLKQINIYDDTNILKEFIITNITYVKDFIVNSINPIINPIINQKYLNAKLNKDYTIEIANLELNDILYNNELVVLVKLFNAIDINEVLHFNIKIKYDYDIEAHIEVVDAIFKPAISKEFWKNRGNSCYKNIVWLAATYKKVSEDIKTAKPLDWLLSEPHLPFKIAVELSAASHWTTFYWYWWAVKKNSGEPGGAWSSSAYSLIPNEGKKNSIRSVGDIFRLYNIYFNKIFLIIEKKLNSLNIKCKVKKKTVKYSNNSDDFAFGVGCLNFNYSKDEINNDTKRNSQYYIAVNFDVIFENNIIREYAGVIFSLSDELELYS